VSANFLPRFSEGFLLRQDGLTSSELSKKKKKKTKSTFVVFVHHVFCVIPKRAKDERLFVQLVPSSLSPRGEKRPSSSSLSVVHEDVKLKLV
jgi:hypothetical protein